MFHRRLLNGELKRLPLMPCITSYTQPLWVWRTTSLIREVSMKAKLIHDPFDPAHGEQGEKTFAIIFDKGDEVISGLTVFAKRNNLGGSHFTAVGEFSGGVLGYFNWAKRGYEKIPL